MARFFPDFESYTHKDNGMTITDMLATLNVARLRNEVIMFRSTGYWSRRWIDRGHPTKPFHVKGKSSDWGPMAGFVPCKAIFSKVGSDPEMCWKGELLNGEGIHGGFAARQPLLFTQQELDLQTKPDDRPGGNGRCPIKRILPNLVGTPDVWMLAERTDTKDKSKKVPFVFVARRDYTRDLGDAARGKYAIYSLDERYGSWAESGEQVSAAGHKVARREALQRFIVNHAEPVYCMKSAEVDAHGRTTDLPLTGDYDLFAVGPHYNDYGSADKRLDMTLNDLALEKRIKTYQDRLYETLDPAKFAVLAEQLNFIYSAPHDAEDPHKGNVTPRILAVIAALNYEMARLRDLKTSGRLRGTPRSILGQDGLADFGAVRVEGGGFGAYLIENPTGNVRARKEKLRDDHYLFRRVHHNQEASRPFLSAKKNEQDQVEDLLATFPLTAFHPRRFPKPYDMNVLTLESYDDLKHYYKFIYEQGYALPKNPVWGYPSYLKDLEARNK